MRVPSNQPSAILSCSLAVFRVGIARMNREMKAWVAGGHPWAARTRRRNHGVGRRTITLAARAARVDGRRGLPYEAATRV